MLQQLLKQLFLVWLLNNSLTRGGAFPGAIRFGNRVSPHSFPIWGVPFCWPISRSLFFWQKMTLGAKSVSKKGPKSTKKATSELIFTFFKEPWFWTTLQWFWRIFRVPLTMKYTKRHQKSECETAWNKNTTEILTFWKIFKNWPQNDSQNVTW